MVGDLLATVKLPNAHGLKPGSSVVFRGQPCGVYGPTQADRDVDGQNLRRALGCQFLIGLK